MALNLQQLQKQTQRLIMTPQMQQSIQLLQLNAIELEQMTQQELLENPFLTLEEEKPAAETTDGEREEFTEVRATDAPPEPPPLNEWDEPGDAEPQGETPSPAAEAL